MRWRRGGSRIGSVALAPPLGRAHGLDPMLGLALPLALALALGVTACQGDAHPLVWGFAFEDDADRANAENVVATLEADGCGGVEVFREVFPVSAGMGMSRPDPLDPGTYGVRGVAIDDDCDIVASACVEIVLPPSDATPFVVTMRHESGATSICGATESCVSGRCVGGAPDGGTRDAGRTDGGADGGRPDGGGDAGDCGGADLMTDDENCGTCGNACGSASCIAGICRDTARDPTACGTPPTTCDDDEYCSGGTCTCRPGLTRVGMSCTDLQSDPSNCGAVGMTCTVTEVCSAGSCVTSCSAGLTACGRSCVDLSTDPLHCGSCSRMCAADQVCEGFGGECRDYRPALDCTMCPCRSTCVGSFDTCRSSYGTICVRD